MLGASRGAVRAPSDKATDCPRKDRRVRVLLAVPSSAPLLSAAALILRAHDACDDRDDADAGRNAGENAPHKLDEVTTRRPRRTPCRERDRTIMSKTVGGAAVFYFYSATHWRSGRRTSPSLSSIEQSADASEEVCRSPMMRKRGWENMVPPCHHLVPPPSVRRRPRPGLSLFLDLLCWLWQK